MLKRRILASSLASVMAISSIVGSAVAFAAEDDVITKDFLKEYLDEQKKVMESELREYGPQISDHFRDAYDYAKNVLNDSK